MTATTQTYVNWAKPGQTKFPISTDLTPTAVTVNGSAATYTVANSTVTITSPALAGGEKVVITATETPLFPVGGSGGGSGGLVPSNNLSDIPSPSQARVNLGITATAIGALALASNLSDIPSPATARTNLGVTPAAIGALSASSNLSDVANAATARTNLGVTPAAIGALSTANNLSDVANAATARTNLGVDGVIRKRLTAATTYYIRSADGNDANTGSANDAAHAFATLQGCYDYLVANIDSARKAITVQCTGTFTAGLNADQPVIGGGTVTFLGNAATPSSVQVNCAGATCFAVSGRVRLIVNGFKLTTSGGAFDCLQASFQGRIDFANIEFGASGETHLSAYGGGEITCFGANYAISGGGTSHLHAYLGGRISLNTCTVTITNTPAFSDFFAGVSWADIGVVAVTWNGAATGKKFLVHQNGLLDCNGAALSYLPGNAVGTANSGGVYVGVEGWQTFQPVIGSAGGTIGTGLTGTIEYLQQSDIVFVNGIVSITNAGTGTGALLVTLPLTITSGFYLTVQGEIVSSGAPVFGLASGNNMISMLKGDATTPIASGNTIKFSGWYRTDAA